VLRIVVSVECQVYRGEGKEGTMPQVDRLSRQWRPELRRVAEVGIEVEVEVDGGGGWMLDVGCWRSAYGRLISSAVSIR